MDPSKGQGMVARHHDSSPRHRISGAVDRPRSLPDNPIVRLSDPWRGMSTVLKEKVRLGSKRQLTIPQEALAKLHLREGDIFELRVLEGKMELVPMALIPRDQLWYWTPEWQAKEKEADEDIAAGRVKQFKSARKAIKALKS